MLVSTKDYIGGVEYQDGAIEATYHAEGRVFFTSSTQYRHEYAIKDHLGNIRLWVSDLNGNGILETPSEILQEKNYYPFGMEMEGPWMQSGANNPYQYNGKELVSDFGLNFMDYGARWYDAAAARWWSVDPLADHPNQIDKSPFAYGWNNPVTLNDPDGKCPWCGFVGALTEAGTQISVNYFYKGQTLSQSIKNVDIADVTVAGVEATLTGGTSIVKRFATKATIIVASEIVQNTVDAKVEDLYNKGTDGIKVEKNVGKIVENTGIGLLSNGAGELVGGGLKVATNSKYTKELKQVDRELNRSAKGSNGESTRMAKETQLNATIEGNKKVADAVGTVTTESLDAVFKK